MAATQIRNDNQFREHIAQTAKRVAFDRLAKQHRPTLTRHTQQLTGNHEAAEDLLQDTLTRAFCKFDTFKIGTDFVSWAKKTMLNLHIDKKRGAAREVKRADLPNVGHDADYVDDRSDSADLQLAAHLHEAAARLPQALRELTKRQGDEPTKKHQVLLLKYASTLSARAIAEAVGSSENNVHVAHHEGRKKLCESLNVSERDLDELMTEYVRYEMGPLDASDLITRIRAWWQRLRQQG